MRGDGTSYLQWGIDCFNHDGLAKAWGWTKEGRGSKDPNDASSVMAEFEAEIETEMRAAFEELDGDSSGALSVEEVGELVQKLEPGLYATPKKAAAAAAKLFKECDSDNSGELDYEEFAVYWKREGHKKSKGRWGAAKKAAAAGGGVFTVVKTCMVRAGYDTLSAKVGLMEVGTVFVALESRTDDDGWQRVRLDRGWVTAAGPTGVYARAGSKDPNECALILLSRRPGLALRVRLAS